MFSIYDTLAIFLYFLRHSYIYMDKFICRKEKFSILWKIGDYFCIDSLDFLCMIGENTLSEKNLKFNTFF